MPPSISTELPFPALLAAATVQFVLVLHDLADFRPVLGAQLLDDLSDGLILLN